MWSDLGSESRLRLVSRLGSIIEYGLESGLESVSKSEFGSEWAQEY
jgi:hypothetical protein